MILDFRFQPHEAYALIDPPQLPLAQGENTLHCYIIVPYRVPLPSCKEELERVIFPF